MPAKKRTATAKTKRAVSSKPKNVFSKVRSRWSRRYTFAALLVVAGLAGLAGLKLQLPIFAAGSYDLKVASFNLQSVTLDATNGDQRPWKLRRPYVIKNIMTEKPDVFAAQEAYQGNNLDGSRYVAASATNQFMDLYYGLKNAGGAYKMTSYASYNCVNPDTHNNCAYQERGAGHGDRIYYNSNTLTLIRRGSLRYSSQTAQYPLDRYMVWGIFQINSTGKQFLFTGTHLHTNDDKVNEWKELITKVNSLKGSMPVINAGDYNVNKFSTIAPQLLSDMKNAGYGDVLNQKYAENPIAQPRALKTLNGWINSFNHESKNVRDYSYADNHQKAGNNIDFIFATNALIVKEWKVVLNFDPTTLIVNGVLPSDHNMVQAVVTIP